MDVRVHKRARGSAARPCWTLLVLAIACTAPARGPSARSDAAQRARSDALQRARSDALIDAIVLRAWRACERHSCSDALGELERAERSAPQRADLQLLLGEALFWQQRPSEARAHYERAAQLVPTLEPAYRGIGHSCFELSKSEWNHPRTRARLLEHAYWAFQIARVLEPADPSASDGARKVAEALTPDGHSLGALEVAIAVLLAALGALLAVRARARLRAGGLRALLHAYRGPLFLFAGSRALVLGAFALAPRVLAEAPTHPVALLHHASFVLETIAGRWDSNLYVDVAARGYRIERGSGPGVWSSVGQFPLVPVLDRWLAYALDDRHLAALLLPNLALLCASLLLYGSFRARLGERAALFALAVLLLHPGSLYGSVLYSEPLALLGLAGAYAAMERRAPLETVLWGTLAGLARFSSVALVPWLLYDGWRRGDRVRKLWPALGPLLGVALFMGYLQLELGDGLAYFHELRGARLVAEGTFVALHEAGITLASLFTPQLALRGPLPWLLFALACVGLYGALLAVQLRARELGPALYVAGGMLLALTSNLAAQPRYLWLLFPVAPTLIRVLAPAGSRSTPLVALLIASGLVLVAAAIAYSRWYYVT